MTAAQQTDQADVEAIKQVVATVEHAQRNELPEEFLGLFRADAIWTTGGGKRLFGLDEISAFTRQALPGGMKGKGLSVAMEVAHVLFIRPDVAAVKVRQQYSNLDGSFVNNQDIVFNEGTPLFVMAKEEDQGAWWPARTPRSSRAPSRMLTSVGAPLGLRAGLASACSG